MVEIWKNSDYENYQFSNTGKARNSKTGKILKPYPDKQGYLGIAVYIKESKKQKRIQVHREVAKLFVDVPERLKHIPIEQLEVDHYNEIKSDNRACNFPLTYKDLKTINPCLDGRGFFLVSLSLCRLVQSHRYTLFCKYRSVYAFRFQV